MNFVTVVPVGGALEVESGIDGLPDSHNIYNHEQALKVANDWNEGRYHPDVWVQFKARDMWGDLVDCNLLYNDRESKVIGFLFAE